MEIIIKNNPENITAIMSGNFDTLAAEQAAKKAKGTKADEADEAPAPVPTTKDSARSKLDIAVDDDD